MLLFTTRTLDGKNSAATRMDRVIRAGAIAIIVGLAEVDLAGGGGAITKIVLDAVEPHIAWNAMTSLIVTGSVGGTLLLINIILLTSWVRRSVRRSNAAVAGRQAAQPMAVSTASSAAESFSRIISRPSTV